MGLIYQPSYVINVYYFDKFLGRANSISQTGTGVGIFALPPLLQLLIETYGWRGSLILLAAGLAHIAVCGALFRPSPLERQNRKWGPGQLEGSRHDTGGTQSASASLRTVVESVLQVFDLTLLRYLYFNILLAVNFQISYSYAIVLLYLPSRATSFGISELRAASLVSALGIGSLVSRLTHGLLIDYNILSTSVLTALSLLVCGIVSLLNPVSDNYWVLAALSAVVGLTSGVYVSTYPILAKEYVGVDKVSGGIGWIHMMQGIAALISVYATGTLNLV